MRQSSTYAVHEGKNMFDLSKMSVRNQLLGAFGVVILLLLVVATAGVVQLSASNDRFANFIADDLLRNTVLSEARLAINRRAVSARNIVLVTEPAERETERAAAAADHTKVQESLAKLKAAIAADPTVSEKEKALFAAVEKVETQYGPVALEIVRLGMEGKRNEAIDMMNKQCRPLLNEVRRAAKEYADYLADVSRADVESSRVAYSSARALMLTLSAIAALIGIGLSIVIARALTRALGGEPSALKDVATRVAAGDLSHVAEAQHAPSGSVMASMGDMQQALVKLIAEVRQSADGVLSYSQQIAQGNVDLSGRTEQQASSLEETAASMEEMASTVQSNADATVHANQLAVDAAEQAGRGSEAIGKVESVMSEINESSRRITDIISVIDGIAFQTNILALNAAVEAARAGEQGRGFAVVASEVRTLAQRSANAAKDIKGLIGESAGKAREGAELVNSAVHAMSLIRESAQNVASILDATKTAAAEQSAGIQQVNTAVSQLDEMTQQNAALVEESTAAATSLKDQAQRLSASVSMFRLDSGAPLALAAPASVAVASRVAAAPAHQFKARATLAKRPAPKALSNTSAAAKRAPAPAPSARVEPSMASSADTTSVAKPAAKPEAPAAADSKPAAVAKPAAAKAAPKPTARPAAKPSPSTPAPQPAARGSGNDDDWEEF